MCGELNSICRGDKGAGRSVGWLEYMGYRRGCVFEAGPLFTTLVLAFLLRERERERERENKHDVCARMYVCMRERERERKQA